MIKFFVLLSLPFFSTALEWKAQSLFFCSQKTATGQQSRSIRVHQSSDKGKCAVFYSVKGRDQLLSQGRWLSFCRKKARQVADNLQKGLWRCSEHKGLPVFYSQAEKGG